MSKDDYVSDSGFAEGIGDDRNVSVALTEQIDFPQNGAVTLRLQFSKWQGTRLQLKKTEARSLLAQLATMVERGEI